MRPLTVTVVKVREMNSLLECLAYMGTGENLFSLDELRILSSHKISELQFYSIFFAQYYNWQDQLNQYQFNWTIF